MSSTALSSAFTSPASSAAAADTGDAIGAAATRLRTAQSVVVVGHINPDGDALGSIFALTAALRTLDVAAYPTWGARHEGQDPAPLAPALDFLPGSHAVVHQDDLPTNPEVVVSCDTAAATRLGTLEPILKRAGTVIVIDHHAVGAGFGDIRIVDDMASCTGVLILDLITALGVELTPAMADAVYLALLTDTGRFTYASTTPEDHRTAARLIEAGADHVAVADAVYASASRGYLSLVARVTARATVTDQMVSSFATLADLAASGTVQDEPDGLIDLLRGIGGIDVTCFLRESLPGVWRSSLRSKGATDVATIAHQMGGGGHCRAAGFTGRGTPEEILATVRGLLDGAETPA